VKRFILTSKKLFSFLLAFIIVFSLFSDVMVVQAAPDISSVRFTRVINAKTNTSTEILYIFGSGFVEPVVTVGALGNVTAVINKTLSSRNTIVIDDRNTLSEMKGKNNIIKVTTEDESGTLSTDTMNMDLGITPSIESITTSKAYVGTPLDILGNQFDTLNNSNDKLYVAGTPYVIGTDCTVSSGKISISNLKSPNDFGLSDIRIERTINTADTKNEIIAIYGESIIVVNKLTGIEIERVDPNAGPRDRKNLISIYGKPGFSSFTDDIRIFVGDSEGVNKGVIKDDANKVIGVKFELPTRSTAGVVDLILKSKNLSSEFKIPNAFIYLDIGNALSIDSNGIKPNFKKETEDKIIEITGRNIGFFNGTGYDISNVSTNETILGYSSYGSSGLFNDNTYYKVKYTGKYNNTDVTIIREFKFTIDGDATVVDAVYGTVDYTPKFELKKDIVYVSPADVNLNPNEPKSVDVAVRTLTTIFTEPGGILKDIIYNRTEDYAVKNGFTYLPDEVSPDILSVTPTYGPSSKEIYMTIKGKDFQVFADGTLPVVRIGGRICTDVRVYDDNNRVVDGRIIDIGTKVKCRLPGDAVQMNGAVDVIVINPSGGQKTLTNGFEFRNEGESRVVTITSVKNPYADVRGGIISGETVVITGDNFDTSADNNHRIVITIDGEKATIIGKVSSDGKSVTIIPPPGTVPGMTKLQIINQDGSMASEDFEYKLITSNPKITSVVPSKGGKGAKLVIKGEDFIFPDETVDDPNDTKRKGTVVLLGGRELNAYNYGADGKIVEDGSGSIHYYNAAYDPDGTGGVLPYVLTGEMVKVIDSTTIYVDLPDRYYRFGGGSSPYLLSENIPLGNLKVEVLSPDGAKSKENVFFDFMKPLTAPIISSMSPDNGSVDGGTVVTITGSGFKEDKLEVYFGSEKVTKLNFINSTEIRATVPKYPYPIPGGKDELIVPVMVVNYDGGTAVRDGDDGFKYKIPSSHPVITVLKKRLTEELVTSGSSAGGDIIKVTGLDFRRETVGGNPPDVYFNGVKAKVEWPDNNTGLISEMLVVTVPASLVSGPVDIVLVNYDAGSCTYKGFSYSMSKPAITSITPNVVSNLGNINLEIKGSGFRQGDLMDLFPLPGNIQEQVARDTQNPKDAGDVVHTIVAFGDEATGDKKKIDTIIGPFDTVIDDLKFEFERIGQGTARITVRRASDNTVVIRQLRDANNNIVPTPMEVDIPIGSSHMFILNHSADLGNSLSFDEGILVETTPSFVTITRRIAPYAAVKLDGTKVTATAPPIDTEGSRSIYVINDDGGKASARINVVSPDSKPTIVSIEPVNHGRLNNVVEPYNPANRDLYTELYTYVPVAGGAFLTIRGSDYRRNVKVYMEDKLLEIVSKSSNDDELVVKVPVGALSDIDKQYRIIIVNEDGGVADSSQMAQPYYVEYQASNSKPVVESIVPNKSSNGRANRVTITGYNFENGVVVSLDGVPCVTVRDDKKPGEILRVTIPAGISPGKKLVTVQNGDYGYCEVKDGITIISSPLIDSVLNSKGQIIDPVVFSIEGGESIQLKGAGFMADAKVIMGGVLKPKSQLAQGESGLECLGPDNVEMVVVGGIQVTGAKVVGSDTITFITPKLASSDTSVIVINADGGVSNVMDASYQKPKPDAPSGIKIEVVDGDTIRLEWNKVDKATYYELYIAIKYDKKDLIRYMYFASVIPQELDKNRVVYYVEELTPSTAYSFKIRAVNNYTISNFGPATKYVETDDEIKSTNYQGTGEFQQTVKDDKVVFKGTEVIYTAGERSIGSSNGVTVDFDKQHYGSSTAKSLELSLNQIKKYPYSKIYIKDGDIELNMTPNNLAVDEAIAVDSALQGDTMLKVSINRSLGAKGDDVRISIPRGYKIITSPFGIDAYMQVGKDIRNIRSLKGQADMTLKYDEAKGTQFAGGVYIAYYDSGTGKLEIIETQRLKGILKAKVYKSGAYAIIGKMLR
jgi:hypothetical protein